MSLAQQIEDYGLIAYLFTVSADRLPHVVSVRVAWDGEAVVVAGAGRTTSANAAANPDVSVVWAAPPGSGYCLIVDGRAAAAAETAADVAAAPGGLRIMPTRAVLHRTPEGDPAAPNCVTVLARQ